MRRRVHMHHSFQLMQSIGVPNVDVVQPRPRRSPRTRTCTPSTRTSTRRRDETTLGVNAFLRKQMGFGSVPTQESLNNLLCFPRSSYGHLIPLSAGVANLLGIRNAPAC